VERAQREREMFRMKTEHLEELMDQRARELTTMALHLVQKNTFLQKLRKDATQLVKDVPEAKKGVDAILRAIDEDVRGEGDWNQFEEKYQHVHQGFISTLTNRCPKLTPTELKVCGMLRMNLSNKEIMRLLSVSLRNVESHRYSIRTKLELASDVNLASYLAGL
jgi:DNA-binding CsgD family transcriptional regulator